MEYTSERKLMIDINRMKNADNGSMTMATAPIGNGRLKEYFSVSPPNNTLSETKESAAVLKKEKKADTEGFNDPLRNKDAIPPAKSKKMPAKNKITVSTFGGI